MNRKITTDDLVANAQMMASFAKGLQLFRENNFSSTDISLEDLNMFAGMIEGLVALSEKHEKEAFDFRA